MRTRNYMIVQEVRVNPVACVDTSALRARHAGRSYVEAPWAVRLMPELRSALNQSVSRLPASIILGGGKRVGVAGIISVFRLVVEEARNRVHP